VNPFPFAWWQIVDPDDPPPGEIVRPWGDVLAVAEDLSVFKRRMRDAKDAATLLDGFARATEERNRARELGDILSVQEVVALHRLRAFLAADAATLTDGWARATEERNRLRAWGDVLGAADALALEKVRQLLAADTAALAEAWGRTAQERNLARAWGDTLGAADSVTLATIRALLAADAAVFNEAWGRTAQERNVIRSTTDTLLASDALGIHRTRPLMATDNATTAETWGRSISERGVPARGWAETIGATDSMQINKVGTVPGSFQAVHDQDACLIPLLAVDLSWDNVGQSLQKTLEWRNNPAGAWTTLQGAIAAGATTYRHTGMSGAEQYYRISFNGLSGWAETNVSTVCIEEDDE
jgi:hypothetical protein